MFQVISSDDRRLVAVRVENGTHPKSGLSQLVGEEDAWGNKHVVVIASENDAVIPIAGESWMLEGAVRIGAFRGEDGKQKFIYLSRPVRIDGRLVNLTLLEGKNPQSGKNQVFAVDGDIMYVVDKDLPEWEKYTGSFVCQVQADREGNDRVFGRCGALKLVLVRPIRHHYVLPEAPIQSAPMPKRVASTPGPKAPPAVPTPPVVAEPVVEVATPTPPPAKAPLPKRREPRITGQAAVGRIEPLSPIAAVAKLRNANILIEGRDQILAPAKGETVRSKEKALRRRQQEQKAAARRARQEQEATEIEAAAS